MMSKPNQTSVFLCTPDSLNKAFGTLNEKKYRTKQIFEGLYKNFFGDWNDFTTLPKELRKWLGDNFFIESLTLNKKVKSLDQSTQKLLFQTRDHFPVESVLMNKSNRYTLCISTQSGCAMNCAFCATGKLGLNRNLTSWEIVEQVIFTQRSLHKDGKNLTNIVLMGMGEPLQNFDNVMQFIHIINDPVKLNFGARRITISTIGLIEPLKRFLAEDIQVNLAISLHAPENGLRSLLVPANTANPIESILSVLDSYIKKSRRRVTIEYVLIHGLNDSSIHAKKLSSLLKNSLYHINLIPLNPTAEFKHYPPPNSSIQNFARIIHQNGIPVSIRQSQGTDIWAGCGQLAGNMYHPTIPSNP